jgi:hypothetical protein
VKRLTEAFAAMLAPLLLPFALLAAMAARLNMFTVDNFIPSIWTARILVALRKNLVYAGPGVANRDYEGEIRNAGDTVKINSVGDVTIFDYVKNTDMPAPETLTDEQRTLTITESPAFNFQVDDVDKAQTLGNVMGQGMDNAAFQLRDRADRFVASHYTEVAAENLIGTDASPELIATPGEAYEALVELAVVLDEANVPASGRWVVLPPWFHGLLLRDDRFVAAGSAGSDAVLRNGQVGMAAGFAIMMSNNAPTGDPGGPNENRKIIAGYPGAASYAEQINQTEAYRPERRFGDAVKGLHLYGAKLVRPRGWAVLSARRG